MIGIFFSFFLLLKFCGLSVHCMLDTVLNSLYFSNLTLATSLPFDAITLSPLTDEETEQDGDQ